MLWEKMRRRDITKEDRSKCLIFFNVKMDMLFVYLQDTIFFPKKGTKPSNVLFNFQHQIMLTFFFCIFSASVHEDW